MPAPLVAQAFIRGEVCSLGVTILAARGTNRSLVPRCLLNTVGMRATVEGRIWWSSLLHPSRMSSDVWYPCTQCMTRRSYYTVRF